LIYQNFFVILQRNSKRKEKQLMEKVFVLSIDWCIKGEYGKQTRVFTDIFKARKALKEDFDDVAKDYQDWVEDFDDDCASIYEEGNYNDCHCDWEIGECEVE